jgi:glutathione S-transferase
MLKLYDQARSRASRSLWLLEEIGSAYLRIAVRPYTESRHAHYLRINLNGRIPSLEDEGFVLRESLAINLCLGRRDTPRHQRDRAVHREDRRGAHEALS